MNENKQEEQKGLSDQSSTGFETLSLRPELLKSLKEIGYKVMFPIQAASIPPMLKGKNVICQAHTGSGKTAAYALSILQRIDGSKHYVQALVVVPTRELALQVTDEFNKIAKYLDVKAFSIYGGQAITPQIERLHNRTPQVIVATPGRLIDHIERSTIDLQDVQTVILDEADRMLDMGFIDDIDYIMKQIPSGSQTALFSATMPQEIVRLSRKYMSHPEEVLIDSDELSLEGIDQKYAMVDERGKFAALIEYVRKSGISSGIIFCSTKIKTQRLAERLKTQGLKAAPIHGDLSQNQREHAMRNFKHGYVELLVATDVAARGIDVPAISHVINYDVPQDPLTYFHRIGRTARAGKPGESITLVSSGEYPDFSRISGMTEMPIKRVTDILPEGYRPPPASSDGGRQSRQFPSFRSPSPFGRGGGRFAGERFSSGGGRGQQQSTSGGFRRQEGSGERGKQRQSGFSFTEHVASSSPSSHLSYQNRERRGGGGHFSTGVDRRPGSRSTGEPQRERKTDGSSRPNFADSQHIAHRRYPQVHPHRR
ncbi:MAG: DEAD/DEAH box helicase [Nitrososphaerales archaeon]